MKRVILITTAVLTAGVLAACGGEVPSGEMADMKSGHHMSKGIEISSAHVKPPFPGRDVAAGFFKVTNHGADDRLVSVSSPISENVEIHTHENDNGVMKMRKIDGVDLPSGETVVFKPGSYHIMMFGANLAEGQEDVAITLNYAKAEAVTLIVPVTMDGPEEDEHAGH